jgi:phage terminase large subunit-like protein
MRCDFKDSPDSRKDFYHSVCILAREWCRFGDGTNRSNVLNWLQIGFDTRIEKKDSRLAFEWYLRAAKAEPRESQYDVGIFF